MADDTVIISCALIGGLPSENPNHPVNADDIVRHGVAAAKAGAAIVHIHARTRDGEPTQDADVYRWIGDAIRSEVDVMLNYTTGGSPGMTDDERLASLGAAPELASLDAGTLNFNDFVFTNTVQFLARAAQDMLDANVKPEIECFDSGHVMAGIDLLQRGLVEAPPLFQLVLGVRGGAPPRVEALLHLVSLLPPGAVWGAFSIGRMHFPMMAAVLAMGGHIRTGMEDCAYTARGVRAASNAELVERAVAMCKTVGRPVATVEQAREILARQPVAA
jgi:3-keto-5-aminohexanoate cleavage enzyme